MSIDPGDAEEVDLDRTDRLPILEGILVEDDVLDDSEPLDYRTHADPAAAEAEGAAQAATAGGAEQPAAELAALQAELGIERQRARELERALSEAQAAAAEAQARGEQWARQAGQHQIELRDLRDALESRNAALAQIQHSLGERDAQLFALQREHAQTVPALEARRARGESELAELRRDLGIARAQAAAHAELTRSREWRGAFERNRFLAWIDETDPARRGEAELRAECERLRGALAGSQGKLAEQEAAIAELRAAGDAQAVQLAATARDLEEASRRAAELRAGAERFESERRRLHAELEARGREALAAQQELAAADARHAELWSQTEQLRTEALAHDEELTVLMAHLNEARRPVQAFHADIKKLQDELALKTLSVEELGEQNRSLRAALERTRAALEERELTVRRLERSANISANALGRLQTSIERLGAATAPPAAGEFTADLIRLDGETRTVHRLGRRTRIGRAPGCELQIDSQSVSRHHALLLQSAREIIVEDLNSTNGVLVNGRRVTRQLLGDGDLLTIGEVRFQCRLVADRPPRAGGGETHPTDAQETVTHPAETHEARAAGAALGPAETPSEAPSEEPQAADPPPSGGI